MRACVLFLLVAAFSFGMPHLSSAADIFGYFLADPDAEGRESEDENLRTCECREATCMCCVDFNLTYIDLGGPGCVQMKYISQEKGLKLNVSYGESLLHSQEVKGPNPDATCMSLLTDIAGICARFSNLLPHNEGLRGCLLLEPKLLKAVTATFKIGCFTMGPDGMKLEEGNATASEPQLVENLTEGPQNQNESAIINEDLLSVVNETAEKGLAFLGSLFGLTFEESADTETDDLT
ncbi:uncharacterized protein LOC109532952 isoform X2 [Dendroctonus ponderosae]|uniref:uncharacterized protein LOC109532952 isoform X2 n=1 Tax=Dendroctonus ponderosae TaxID=77166 RepID=UPI002035A42A|nr:uncharacterized protein LOC109532952 isoform X2 [Dendroctonus ponderosae]